MELVMEQEAPAGEVCLTPEAMDAYLDTLRQQGRSADTLAAYRRSIYGLYRSLPPDKRVGRGTLDRWRETLEDQGYLPRTINVRLAAANGLMTYLGHRELQATAALPPPAEGERPELTRGEYDRLLETARSLGRERLALVMETLCATGIRVSEVRYITVEAARAGRAEISLKGKIRTILLPQKLCRKLRKYARKNKIASGEIFLTRSRSGLSRKQIWAEMKALCGQAGIAPTKVFPHNLRHLFARTFYKVCCDVVKLADLLGHSSVETTRIYLISSGADHARQLEQLGLVR